MNSFSWIPNFRAGKRCCEHRPTPGDSPGVRLGVGTIKKLYQTEWQDIRFSDFAELSSAKVAAPEFYQRFYEEFFKRYQDWEQVSPSWRGGKERWAEFILARIEADSRVLSVGCGLGAVEHYIHSQNPQLDLSIHEVAPSALRWIGQEFPEDHKFTGLIPACLPEGVRFDLIYLATVDYPLDDDVLVGLLAALRRFLTPGRGRCLLISGSFEDTPGTLKDRAVLLKQRLKAVAAAGLDIAGLRPRGQLWGWIRTQREYRALMQRAGYSNIEDGFVDPDQRTHYWIAGR